MPFKVEKFLLDKQIDFSHQKKGWLNVHCPFCAGTRNYHLGIHLTEDRGHCWRCGGKQLQAIVQTLLGISWGQAGAVVKEYDGRVQTGGRGLKPRTGQIQRLKTVNLPNGTGDITPAARRYLEDRGFNVEYLVETFGIGATGYDGHIVRPGGDILWYKHRIIIPIITGGILTSYQGRDITGKCINTKYMACPLELEAIDHKKSLYAIDLATGEACCVVEGVTDVWRLGPGSVATFGTAFLLEQVAIIAARFKKVFILFDPEPTAQKRAKELAWLLASEGLEVEIITIDGGDPGAMGQWEADKLMLDLGLL